jgi:hypothetical protein
MTGLRIPTPAGYKPNDVISRTHGRANPEPQFPLTLRRPHQKRDIERPRSSTNQQKDEFFGRHAHDDERLPRKPDGLSGHLRIALEGPLPEIMTQHDYRTPAGRSLFFGQKTASQRHIRAEQGEVTGRYQMAEPRICAEALRSTESYIFAEPLRISLTNPLYLCCTSICNCSID